MNQVKNKLKESSGKVVLLFIWFLLVTAGSGRGQCPNVDLQAVSIDPSALMMSPLGTIKLVVEMKNNGPCPIPIKEARFTISFPDKYIQPGNPLNVVDNCVPTRWKLFNSNQADGFYSFTFRNDAGPIPVGGAPCPMSFSIRGKGLVATEPITISLSSSLTALSTKGDLNGLNQSASTKLFVGTKPSPPPTITITDFNVKANDCNAVLTWKTSSNNNVDSFEVEYGFNEKEFTRAGVLQNKNSNAGSTYEYVKDQGNGKRFYRIKVLAKNGKIIYSEVVGVDTKCIIKKGF